MTFKDLDPNTQPNDVKVITVSLYPALDSPTSVELEFVPAIFGLGLMFGLQF
jgi:hypothetical protein